MIDTRNSSGVMESSPKLAPHLMHNQVGGCAILHDR
jgi:hypothetical protein